MGRAIGFFLDSFVHNVTKPPKRLSLLQLKVETVETWLRPSPQAVSHFFSSFIFHFPEKTRRAGDSDGFGCQKSSSGRVRVSPSRVWVGFGCWTSGPLRVSGFFGF